MRRLRPRLEAAVALKILLTGIGVAASACVFLGLLLLMSWIGVDMPR